MIKMNDLLVLRDKTDLFDRQNGFVVVRRDFELEEQRYDLGFAHTQTPVFDAIIILFP